MNKTHTPAHSKAPWILEGNYIRSSDVHEIGPIAAVNMDNMKFSPNSDLLLAAPALLAALQEIDDLITDGYAKFARNGDKQQMIRAAINLATGKEG